MNSGDVEMSEKKKNRPNPKKRLMIRMRKEKELYKRRNQSDGSDQSKNRTKKPTPSSSLLRNPADGPANKKARFEEGEKDGEILSIKMLIPSLAIGAIIGRNGQELNTLRKDHKCQIQISKDGDTYPGTTERICFVKGRLNHIVAVIESIQEKIRKKCPNQTGNDAFDLENTLRGDEIKIVMPYTSSRMVIGKSKANIKLIRKHFGCQIEIYPQDGSAEADTSLDRVVTVAHEESAALLRAVRRILKHVVSDPHHSSKINKEDFKKAARGKEKEKEQEKEKEKVHEDEMKLNLCFVDELLCFRNCKLHYQLTGEVSGCPTPIRGHPTIAQVQQWIIAVEEEKAREARIKE
ncbi:hypothetical protein CRE_28671 [Caenorhabditis remanei]|uniref:K Homology domain-containing protein n=1 Tax=Caenorhabditis remanei TaxID=31234 RepID=E3MJY2_CAERE|nr:hypothetical protein CRE_28671 [Caenorhabditis remanei]